MFTILLVYPCAIASCGHFYHPKCIAELLFCDKEKAKIFQSKLAVGDSFACPYHSCTVCKEKEYKEICQLQFAYCRRCPTSYHRKCLPREISFQDTGQGIFRRAWDDLLPKRILIYCLRHEIDENLQAPLRNHLIFPGIPEEKNKPGPSEVLEKKEGKKPLRKRKISESLYKECISVEPSKLIEKLPHAVDTSSDITETKHYCHNIDENLRAPLRNHVMFPEIPEEKNKPVPSEVPEKNKGKKPLRKRMISENLYKECISVEPSKLIEKLPHAADTSSGRQSDITETKHSCHKSQKAKLSEGRKGFDHDSVSFSNQGTDSAPEVTPSAPADELNGSFPEIDNGSLNRVKSLMYEISSLLRAEDVEDSKIETSYGFSIKHTDVSIKHGNVEGSFEAALTTSCKQKGGKPDKHMLKFSITYATDQPMDGDEGKST